MTTHLFISFENVLNAAAALEDSYFETPPCLNQSGGEFKHNVPSLCETGRMATWEKGSKDGDKVQVEVWLWAGWCWGEGAAAVALAVLKSQPGAGAAALWLLMSLVSPSLRGERGNYSTDPMITGVYLYHALSLKHALFPLLIISTLRQVSALLTVAILNIQCSEIDSFASSNALQ